MKRQKAVVGKQKAEGRRQKLPGQGQADASVLRSLLSPSAFPLPAFCLLPFAFCLLLACCLLLSGCGGRPPAPAADGRPRIVSLSPSITEIVCAVGAADCLVGRSKVCDYPAAALMNVPVVGDFCSPSLEKLLAVRPTLILEVDSADAATDRRIAELGIPVRHIACAKLDDIPGAIRAIGACAGRTAEAERLAAEFATELARLRKAQLPAAKCPAVFTEIWADPLMTAGRDSFIAELVRLAGGRNLGDEFTREYVPVATEWLIARAPEVILCLNDGPHSANPLPFYRTRNGLAGVPAVTSGRVYGNFNIDVMLKPGPRVLQSVAELRHAIQAAEQEHNRRDAAKVPATVL